MPTTFEAVDVVKAGPLTITEYFGNVASKDPTLSACLASVTGTCEEAYQAPEFDEYVLVLSGEVHLLFGDGTKKIVKAKEGVFLQAGLRVKWTWSGPCEYVPICLPSFTPFNCHREAEDGAVKDAEAMQRLHELHNGAHTNGAARADGEAAIQQTPTDSLKTFEAVDVVKAGALTITEYFGNVASKDSRLSACLATVTSACEEAYQAPEFDEYVLVLSGEVHLLFGDGSKTIVKAREGVLLKAGERVKWTWPGPCEYVPICLPAFSPFNCHREEEKDAVKDAEAMKRLHELHADTDVVIDKKPKTGEACAGRDLAALPKAETHLHLEGAMRPATLTDLCVKYGIERPADTQGQRFSDFGPFAAAYITVCECLREEADLFRLVREVAEDALASGACWIEPALSSHYYASRFGGMKCALEILLRAAEAAEDATGVGIGFVVSAERNLPPSEAEELARIVRGLVESGAATIKGHLGLVGFGLHGPEGGFPPEPFAEAFKIACVGGVVAMPHAGEIAPSPGKGPDSVRFCLKGLGARTIAHGVLAAEDEALVADLASSGVCLDVCPTSNYLLSVCDDLSKHPLLKFLEAGVKCSINSDDPLLFGCNLLGEYECCRREMGLSDDMLAECAKTSFSHSRAPESVKSRGLAGIEAWLADTPKPRL